MSRAGVNYNCNLEPNYNCNLEPNYKYNYSTIASANPQCDRYVQESQG